MPSARQTVTFLRRKFAEIGLFPNPRHGQNFLIDLNLLDFLARTAMIDVCDVVLEIGTGTASLTTRLADQAAHVVTVEIDEHLFGLASEQLADYKNVTMLHQDALRNKNNMHPNVMNAVREAMERTGAERFKLVANLPYSVATAILANLLRESPYPDFMVVTIQKELADRIVAVPNTKDYGALSIWIQSLCDVQIERVLPPTVFWPRPKVTSAIISIDHRPEKRAAIADLDWHHEFVRKVFLHRRKFLRGTLLANFKRAISKQDIDEVLQAMQLGPDSRAEQLTREQLYELGTRIQGRLNPPDQDSPNA